MQRKHGAIVEFCGESRGQPCLVGLAVSVAWERSVEVRIEISLVCVEGGLVRDDELDRSLDLRWVGKDGFDAVPTARFVAVDASHDGHLRNPVSQLLDSHLSVLTLPAFRIIRIRSMFERLSELDVLRATRRILAVETDLPAWSADGSDSAFVTVVRTSSRSTP